MKITSWFSYFGGYERLVVHRQLEWGSVIQHIEALGPSVLRAFSTERMAESRSSISLNSGLITSDLISSAENGGVRVEWHLALKSSDSQQVFANHLARYAVGTCNVGVTVLPCRAMVGTGPDDPLTYDDFINVLKSKRGTMPAVPLVVIGVDA